MSNTVQIKTFGDPFIGSLMVNEAARLGSWAAFARAVGVSQTFIANIRAGTTGPSPKIAAYLGYVPFLMYRIDSRPKHVLGQVGTYADVKDLAIEIKGRVSATGSVAAYLNSCPVRPSEACFREAYQRACDGDLDKFPPNIARHLGFEPVRRWRTTRDSEAHANG